MINAAFTEDSGLNSKKESLQQSLNQCMARREKFLDAIGNGINVDAVKQRIQDSERAIEKLQDEIKILNNEEFVTKESIKSVVKRLMKMKSEKALRHLKIFLGRIIDRIIVDGDKFEIWLTVDAGKKTCKALNVKKLK